MVALGLACMLLVCAGLVHLFRFSLGHDHHCGLTDSIKLLLTLRDAVILSVCAQNLHFVNCSILFVSPIRRTYPVNLRIYGVICKDFMHGLLPLCCAWTCILIT